MTKLGPYELNTIITGDARELAKAIPDESVDLIFTDPVYDRIEDYRWLAETAMRVLKPNGVYLAWAQKHVPHQNVMEDAGLNYQWTLYYTVQAKHGFALAGNIILWTTPCLWFAKGKGMPNKTIVDTFITTGGVDNGFQWNKNQAVIAKWLDAFYVRESVILDPFTGGGTVPAVCKMLGRNYLAFEIDPATADMARERVANTQPPLFVEVPQQLQLEA